MARDRRPDGGETSHSEPVGPGPSDPAITTKSILAAALGGTLGMALMVPLLIGIPQALGVFRTDPVVDFAWLGTALGLEQSLTVGLLLFGAAGAVVLPLLFVVAGAFLPPQNPPSARGVVFATITWTGFVLAFWPGGDLVTVGLFLLFSLLSHWVYGLVLGGTVEYLVGIPQHDV